MKKSLQRIAFGLSIIAASTGVTQSMQAPMKSMTSTTHSEQHAAWIQFTRPFNPASVTDLEKPTSLESLDFKKLRIIDVQSILEGIGIDGKIAPERIEQFRAMLGTPELAMAAFREFLDSSVFPELPDIDKIDVKKFNDGIREILTSAQFPEKIIDHLVSAIYGIFENNTRFVLSVCIQESLKKSETPTYDKMIFSMQISWITSLFTKTGLGYSPVIMSLASFILQEFKKLPNTQLSKAMIYDGVASSIENQSYRNTIVSFLSAFEYKKGEKSFSIFLPNAYSGVSFTDIDGIFTLLSYFDGKKAEYLYPSFLSKSGTSRNFMTHEEGFNYVIYHEFGHAIFDLLGIKTNRNEAFFLENIPDFGKIRSECPEFINKLIFPKLTIETAQRLDDFLRTGLRKKGDFSLQSHIDHFIGQMQNGYAALEWTTQREMLQIAGLLMKNDIIIVNKLSDLDLLVEKHLPARWLHQTAGALSQLLPYPDSSPFPLEWIPSVNEEDFKTLFYLRGINYDTYKSGL